MLLPTVKIKRDGPRGFRIINESDFDASKHVLFDAPAKADPKSDAESVEAMHSAALKPKAPAKRATRKKEG